MQGSAIEVGMNPFAPFLEGIWVIPSLIVIWTSSVPARSTKKARFWKLLSTMCLIGIVCVNYIYYFPLSLADILMSGSWSVIWWNRIGESYAGSAGKGSIEVTLIRLS